MIGYEYGVIPTPLQRMKPTYSVGRILLKTVPSEGKRCGLIRRLKWYNSELGQKGQSEERNNRN
jgi:hypothetical protein